MTTRYQLLYSFPHGFTKALRFKRQWRVVYQINSDGVWEQYEEYFDNRAMARYFKRSLPTHTRWVKLQWRYVQVDWQTYRDTFSYNAKGNGNGR